MTVSGVDSYDKRILKNIQEDGTLGPSDLSPLVYLSPSQCSRRLQRLKAEKYIDRTVVLLNPEKLNLNVSAYIMIKLRSHAREDYTKFRDRMMELPEVVSCESVTGDADYILRVVAGDLASYNRFLTNKLHAAGEIHTATSSIVLQQLKWTTSLALDYC